MRPFTAEESKHLQQVNDDPLFLGDGSLTGNGQRTSSRLGSQAGIRKVINVVDDKMLIFDPPDTNPMVRMQRAAFPTNTTRIREHRFVFDRLFDDTTAQEEIYANTTRPLLDSVLDGYNATVFAYGATGCGKTHTISGNPKAPGIIFLTMKELFERIAEIRDTKLVDISLSYLEIYNETIRDLLEPSNKQLVLREDVDHKISVSNLSSHKPENVEAVMDMILQGNQNRTVSPTEANATSSRSHAVLQINVVQKGRTASISESHTFATLSIIDLAGSERASATKNRGDRLLEGANINKSLLALGNCINALCDPRRRNHVPYRDSKLTRLLKFSLGGNCKTVMIVCVSPSSKHYDETLNTLKYADRAKKIKTKVIRNEHNLDRHVGSYLKMITEQKAEIEELRKRESKAVGIALLNADKARRKCLKVLDDAMDSLRETYVKTAKLQEQTCKILKQLRNIINQINQVECILRSFESVLESSNPLLTQTLPAFTALSEGMKQALQKLGTEKLALEKYCTSVTKDKQMRDTAMATLTRRLEDTPGWTDADRVSFRAQSEALRLKSELEILEEVAGEPIPTKIMENLSLLFFTSMAKMGSLRTADTPNIREELANVTEEIVKICHAQFDKILGDYSISTAELSTKMGLSSILATTIKRPASLTSLQHDILISPSSPGRSSRRTSGGVPSVSHSGRRLSGGLPSRTGGSLHVRALRRQLPGSAKKQVVVKSPMRNHRKAVKRVRWEDDGEICLDPPTPSRSRGTSSVVKNSLLGARERKLALEEEEEREEEEEEESEKASDIVDDDEVKRVLSARRGSVQTDKRDFLSPVGTTDESSTSSTKPKPVRGFGVKEDLRRKSGTGLSRLSMPPTSTAQGRSTPQSRSSTPQVRPGRITPPGRQSPPTGVNGLSSKGAQAKAGKENARPVSPGKDIMNASTDSSSSTAFAPIAATTSAAAASTDTPTQPTSSVNSGVEKSAITTPVTAVRASSAGGARASPVPRSIGAPMRLSVATASSASKHVSQR